MQSVQNPVPAVALPAQPLSVSGAYAHAPPIGTMPGVWSQLPDPSELYAFPWMPYPRIRYSPAPAGRMMPAPITVTTRTVIMTTVTSSIAVSAAQTGLVYTLFTGPCAPIVAERLCRITSVAPHRAPLCGQLALSAATPQRTLHVRNAQVVRRRTAPVCRVMVGPGF